MAIAVQPSVIFSSLQCASVLTAHKCAACCSMLPVTGQLRCCQYCFAVDLMQMLDDLECIQLFTVQHFWSPAERARPQGVRPWPRDCDSIVAMIELPML